MAIRRKCGLLLIIWAAVVFLGFEAWIATREPILQEATIPAGVRTFVMDPFRVTYSTDYYLSVNKNEDGLPLLKARWMLVCDGKTQSSGMIGEHSTWEWIPAPEGSVCHMKLDQLAVHGPVSVQVGEVGWRLERVHRNAVYFSSAVLLFGCALLVRISENKSSRVLRPSLYGLLASLILIPLVIIMTLPGSEHVSQGIWLEPPRRSYDQRWKPLVLRIESASRWMLDGKPVSKDQLPAKLQESFRHRPDWVLKLEADPSLELNVVIRAMDWLQGLGIRVVIGGSRIGHRPGPVVRSMATA